MPNVLEPLKPLRPSQRILDLSTGEVWKIIVRDNLFHRDNELAAAPARGEERSYVYGCQAEGYEDERVVFHEQIGARFLVLG